MAKDPVCGMDVKPEDAAATYDYNGETYYFCADHCKHNFVESPDKYIESDDCCH